MMRNAGRTRFFLAAGLPLLSTLGLSAACSEQGDGGAGGGDRVNSTRVALEAGAGGAGGAGGAAPANPAEPIRICSPDVVIIEGLPECFVAEVSTQPLDCTAPGHEELQPAWEDAARERECAYRSLDAEECASLSLCGLAKVTGAALAACKAGGDGAEPGYCAVDERTEGCSYSEIDTLVAVGVSPDAEALHISCAIVGVE
jgi:hypothetical protein